MQLAFTPERLELFRAKVNATNPKSFDDVVRWYRQQCGVSYGEAKRRAIKSHGKLYNEFCSTAHRQSPSNTARGSSSGSPVQVMSMYSGRTGKPLVQFRGL
jgi:hypothetical protein